MAEPKPTNQTWIELIIDIKRLHQRDPAGFVQSMENLRKLKMPSIDNAVDRALKIADTDMEQLI